MARRARIVQVVVASALVGLSGAAGATTYVPFFSAATDDASHQAFDPATGSLRVNSSFFGQQDLVYNTETSTPANGMPFGSGKVGALTWWSGGLTMQVSAVDAAQQSAFGVGTVTLQTSPAIDASASPFQQRLVMYDGNVVTTMGGNRTITLVGVPGSEVLGIHVVDSRVGVTSATIDVSLWDVSAITNTGDVPSLTPWQTVTTYADSTGVGLSRGQADTNGFGYSLVASVEGATFATSTVSAQDVRITITSPPSSYTVWIAASGRIDHAGDSLTAAKAAVSGAVATTYATAGPAAARWWHSFWGRSVLQYTGGNDQDYLQAAYYLAQYDIAIGASAAYPFHFVNGVERSSADTTFWSNGYWHYNERAVYDWALAANHPEITQNFLNLYSSNMAAMETFTASHWGMSGLWVPEVTGWDGNAHVTTGSNYVSHILSSGAEVALRMYDYYLYTGNASYLSSTVYPFLRDVATFYSNWATVVGGHYRIVGANALETYWLVCDPVTDIAAIKAIFPLAISVSTSLGVDSGPRATWANMLANLDPLPSCASCADTGSTGGTGRYAAYLIDVANGCNSATIQNVQDLASEVIWPWSLTGIGASDYSIALATYNNEPFPVNWIWNTSAIKAARLGLGDTWLSRIENRLQQDQNFPQGMATMTSSNGMFETLGIEASTLQEALLQSHGGVVRVFPAMPTDSALVTAFSLAARGGFVVTSERTAAGTIKYVGVLSNLGNSISLANPWGTATTVRDKSSGAVVITSSSASTLTWSTTAAHVYIAEPDAAPFSGYTAGAFVTGSQNQAKRTATWGSTLGI